MSTIFQSATLNGYKMVNQVMSNEYVQLATQYLSFDFVLMAIFIEVKKHSNQSLKSKV